MRDPYLYEDVPILKNKLNIKDRITLARAESDITSIKLLDVDRAMKDGKLDFEHLKAVHKYIFGDIYNWAGETRIMNIEKGETVLNGLSVRYGDYHFIEKDANLAINELSNIDWKKLNIDDKALVFAKRIAQLWQVHPFREGNTRTVMTFATQFAAAHDFEIDKKIFKEYSDHVRKSLVVASIGEYSEYKYLAQVFKEAIERGKFLKKARKALEWER